MNTELQLEDPNPLVRELLEFLRFELRQAGIRLELELLEPSPLIRLDSKYLKQALLNIVKNAIAAMPQGGTLRIESRRKGNTLQMRVSDTGVGIPEENLDKIFEPYFTTREFGSGLGLTLVYKIVKEHLGEIAVSSKPGEGTTISLSFPIPQKEKRLISYQEESR
jgi:signal transduction histidine kinase